MTSTASQSAQTEIIGTGTIGRGMRCGVAVHTAALAAGLNTRLLPRQVLQVSVPGERSATTAFTHGIPQATTLAAVTYSQDLRMRRGMLGYAGIAQPPGATFSIGRGRDDAKRFADQIGYPVVIKPVNGDSTISVKRGISSAGELDAAFDELLTPVDERPGHTEAAYGITELRKPGWRKGKETVPPGYLLLLEKELAGRYLRILAVDGHIASVVDCPEGPWGPNTSVVEDLGELSESVTSVVQAVGHELPGLRVLSIDVVVTDDSPRNRGAEPVVVVEVSERPWLEVQRRNDPKLAEALGRRILALDLPGHRFDMPKERVETTVEFDGVIDPATFVEVVSSHAAYYGITADLTVTDRALGRVGGSLSGAPHQVAELVEILLDSGIESQVAMKAKLQLRGSH